MVLRMHQSQMVVDAERVCFSWWTPMAGTEEVSLRLAGVEKAALAPGDLGSMFIEVCAHAERAFTERS